MRKTLLYLTRALAATSLALAATSAQAQAFLTMGNLMLGMPRAQVLERLPLLTCKGDRCHAVMAIACGHLRPGAEREPCTKPFLVAGVEPIMWSLEFMDGRLASVYVTVPARHFGKVAEALTAWFGLPAEETARATKDAQTRRLTWQDVTGTLTAVQRAGGSDVSSLSLSTKAHAAVQTKRDAAK